MNFEELIKNTTDLLDAGFNTENNLYVIDYEGETVTVYQDIFENEDLEIVKDIIVCEINVGKSKNTSDQEFILESNVDLFFSRTYISEDDEILIESCLLKDIANPEALRIIIDEIVQHAIYIKDEL